MKKLLIILILILVAAFLWWTVSPLFIQKEVNDELPGDLLESLAKSAIGDMANTTENDPSTTSLLGPFPIKDTDLHPASGEVVVINSPGKSIIRYKDYQGTNGPDLFVYLAKDLEAKEFVNLGRVRGNLGNLNYTVPDGIDISEYQYVLTWCKAFGVLFDYAELN